MNRIIFISIFSAITMLTSGAPLLQLYLKEIMENVNDSHLSFPQRHWFILCVLVAILSPLLVHSVQVLTRKQNYSEATEQKPVHGGTGGMSPSGGAVAPGDSSRSGSVNPMGPANQNEVKDTSYKVAAPPQHK